MARLWVLASLPWLSSAFAALYSDEKSVKDQITKIFFNPVIPGFHPDPSCIHMPDNDSIDNSSGKFYCVSSSFNSFPGIPIHASRNLQRWELIGHVLNRREQLPRLVETNRSTSGLWAPTLRHHDGTFYVTTTLVDDDRPQNDSSRWDNLVFRSDNLYDDTAWTNPVHFDFTGYDCSPFWDDDGRVYLVASHAWRVRPGIELAEADLDSGQTSGWRTIWSGTGGLAPEGPHIYKRDDGFYYLLIAEGGTGLGHMVTMARSRHIWGPYEPHPANPVLTNANTTEYFQAVGHADLFHDSIGNWWSVVLATRSGPAFINYPMGRETVLTSVTWAEGDWPYWVPVRGRMTGPLPGGVGGDDSDDGAVCDEYGAELASDRVDFAPGTLLPAQFTYWRPPVTGMYTVSAANHSHTLRLLPSRLNLTAYNGNYAGASGQTFVGRRQQHTLFTFRIDLDYQPSAAGEEAGVTVFLTQNHHLDLGLVLEDTGQAGKAGQDSKLENELYLRFRGISSPSVPVPAPVRIPVSSLMQAGQDKDHGKITLQVQAANATHYTFSAGSPHALLPMHTVAEVSNEAVSFGFTGVLVGVYCTSNGGNGTTPAYVSNWQYIPQGQLRDKAGKLTITLQP